MPMALYRARCLRDKMQRDNNLAETFNRKIRDYIQKGYIRRLGPLDAVAKKYWYLPIFTVTNPNKPGKVRLVWDAAAKVNGVSSNSVLLKGPDLTTPLHKVLFKFRQKRIAITADIAEMFHQVRVRQEDQNFQRFLWYEPNANEPTTFVMTVMTFGATCSPSCAQFVKNKNAEEFQREFPNASKCIIENHYVDDMLVSVDTEEEAIKLAQDVRHVHSLGVFHIRNFLSNSSRVLTALNEDPFHELSLDLNSELPTEKVLGMWWIMSSDHFAFRVSAKYRNSDIFLCQRRPTKREVLSLIMTIYDPLGLIGFYVTYAKVILQGIWRAGCDWDVPIPDDQFTKWLRWIKLIPKIESLRIPRCYLRTPMNGVPQIALHTFVDASETSYAAVCYLRYSYGNTINCSMIASKTRVAPLKLISIPRLELKAALLGARLAKHVIDSHSIQIDKCVYWSDSRTVLAWLQSDHRRYKQFVAFRVSEILELTNVKEWRWVPSGENVADEATKWNGDPDFSNDNDNEEEEALTPNHFLLGSSSGVKPIAEPVTETILMRRNWRTSQQLADTFWRRWILEYLPTITRRTKWFSDVKPIEVGDIAYLVEPNNPRNCWPKGRVIQVRKSDDGKVRSATLKTTCGIFERPAAKIAVLDLTDSVKPGQQDIPGGSVTNDMAASLT